MELRQIEAFLAIAAFKSFKAASRRLGVTQPAISTRVALLEQELGGALFTRGPRQIQLTPKGALLLPYAEQIAGLADGMISAAAAAPNLVGANVRIGIPSALVGVWAPRLIRKLRQGWPSVRVEVHIDRSPLLREMLRSGHLDVALLLGGAPDPEIRSFPLQPYKYVWVASPDFPIPQRRLSLVELGQHHIVTYARDSTTYTDLERSFRSRGLLDPQLSGSNSSDAILSLARNGIAIGYVLDIAVQSDVYGRELQVLEVAEEPTPVYYFACFPHDHKNSIGKLVAEQASQMDAGI